MCGTVTPALCFTSGLQHKECCLSWHETQCLGHWRTEEDQALLEKVPGKHRPFGEWLNLIINQSKINFPLGDICFMLYVDPH